jgi:cell division protein FtsI/penicillin-binding protein 2
LFSLDESKLEKDFSNKKSLFKLLKDKADDSMLASVRSLNIKGIYTDTKQYRYYPFNELASSLIGFVGVNENASEPIGLYGIEKMYNETLARGDQISFTIDREIQAKAEQTLEELLVAHNGSNATIVVQEPTTGKILALANKPSFNPNEYEDSSTQNFMNTAVQYVYEPGSVFKPFTMSAGIDSGAITPDTTYVDTGSVTLNGATIRNWDLKAHGKVTMTNAIELSLNTATVFAEQKTGHKTFYEYLKRYGFGELSGIDLPDEVRGSIKNLERKEVRDVDYATAAYGQGVSLTPIQLITAFSAIANGGILMRPYVRTNETPYVVRRVIKKETADKVRMMMESAVDKARIAAIPNYHVAGKTGTAFIPDFKRGGYTEDLIQTFVGFAPATNPKFVILIKLDKPNKELAGLTVVPAFKTFAQFILNYYNIPPDRIGETPKTQ